METCEWGDVEHRIACDCEANWRRNGADGNNMVCKQTSHAASPCQMTCMLHGWWRSALPFLSNHYNTSIKMFKHNQLVQPLRFQGPGPDEVPTWGHISWALCTRKGDSVRITPPAPTVDLPLTGQSWVGMAMIAMAIFTREKSRQVRTFHSSVPATIIQPQPYYLKPWYVSALWLILQFPNYFIYLAESFQRVGWLPYPYLT